MATNKSTIIRYKVEDSMLSKRKRYYDVKDLLEHCNNKLEDEGYTKITRRTIEKDLEESLPYLFGAEIETYSVDGKRCKRYIDPSFSIFTEKLTEDEVNLLSEVLNTLGQFEGLENFNWIGGLKDKLKIKAHNKIINFDNNPYLKNSNLLGGLFEKISNKEVIKLSYRPFSSTETMEIVLYPYLLKQYNNRWFLIAGTKDNKLGNYALDRIEKIEVLARTKYKECKIDLEERFEDIVGVSIPEDSELVEVLLWVTNECFPYIYTKPLHSSQTFIKEESILREEYSQLQDGKFIKLYCKINYELKQLLYSYIKDIIVLSPLSLQEEIFQIIEDKKERYMLLRTQISQKHSNFANEKGNKQ